MTRSEVLERIARVAEQVCTAYIEARDLDKDLRQLCNAVGALKQLERGTYDD